MKALNYFDHLGYLFVGVLGFLGLHLLAGWPPMDALTSLGTAAVWTVAAYAAGHVVAFLASLLLERVLVARILGYPTTHLLSERRGSRWVPRYWRPVSSQLQHDITAAHTLVFGESFGKLDAKEQFSLQYHHVIRNDKVAAERLALFLSLYDFARNTSCLALILAVVAFITTGWLVATLLVSAGALFFFRYLKFFRLYAIEVLFAVRILDLKRQTIG